MILSESSSDRWLAVAETPHIPKAPKCIWRLGLLQWASTPRRHLNDELMPIMMSLEPGAKAPGQHPSHSTQDRVVLTYIQFSAHARDRLSIGEDLQAHAHHSLQLHAMALSMS